VMISGGMEGLFVALCSLRASTKNVRRWRNGALQAERVFMSIRFFFWTLMMFDIADTLPLVLERPGRRTKLQIPTMLAILFAGRNLRRRRDGYAKRACNRNGRDYGVSGRIDDIDSVGVIPSHVGSCSVRRDGYPKMRIIRDGNRNGRNYGVARDVDDRDR